MTTYASQKPYYDNFDASQDYHQILFKPGFAVQARELTQSQSILRNQIKNFGDSIYQQGSVVVPGNSYGDLQAQYLKVQTQYNSQPVNTDYFNGKIIVGVTSGVRAYVKYVVPATTTDPIVFFLGYMSGGLTSGVANGKTVFDSGEEIFVEGQTAIRATASASSATGVGSLANVNTGVYYVNGTFANVAKQTVVMDKFGITPSCHVLLKIVETVVDSDTDPTLLDPAQGEPNYAAPGADRLQISLILTVLPLGTALDANYVELMRYEDGVLLEHSLYPKYSELEKSFARRTFDEAGDFVVSGLTLSIRESLKSNNNGGYSVTGSRDNFVATVSPGKAYISGFETTVLSATAMTLPKGRTASHIKSKSANLRPSFGQFIYVFAIAGTLGVRNRETVNLYNTSDATAGAATLLGTAKVTAINYELGDTIVGAIYQLWLTDISLTNGYTLDQIGGIRYTNGSANVVAQYNIPISSGSFAVGDVLTFNTTTRQAKVAYWDSINGMVYAHKNLHTRDAPRVGDNLVGPSATGVVKAKVIVTSVGQSSLLFNLPAGSVSSLKTDAGTYDTQYRVQKELLITTNSSGVGSVTISDGVVELISTNNFMAIGPSGIIQNSLFSLNGAGNTLSITGGPVSTSIKVYALVTKSTASPKTKTITTNVETFASPTTLITLNKADVYSITSITDTVGDITANYDLYDGQTDYAYNRSQIKLKSGRSNPVGTITVTYKYYLHSVGGDFFSADSYVGVSGYLSSIPKFVSPATGKTYDLKNYIDFRPNVGADGTFTGSGAVVNDQVFQDSLFTSTLKFFVPRIDLVVVDKSNKISTIQGVPAINPVSPTVSEGQLALYNILVPAYTETVNDIKMKRLAIDRYTMGDINKMDNRLTRLENFSTLTSLESSLVNKNIVDASSGLSKYKTGYLAENFSDVYALADYTNDKYRAFFDTQNVGTAKELLICNATVMEDSTNYQITDGLMTLPYTEVSFASQPTSSRVTNINPFCVVVWNGDMTLYPSGDSWVEMKELPSILKTNYVTQYVNVWSPAPPVATAPTLVTNPLTWSMWSTPSTGGLEPQIPVTGGIEPLPPAAPVITIPIPIFVSPPEPQPVAQPVAQISGYVDYEGTSWVPDGGGGLMLEGATLIDNSWGSAWNGV